MSADDVQELYRAALACYDRDDLIAAASAFETLLARHSEHIEARYKLGNVRKEQGDLAAAEAQYLRVLRADPAHAESLNNLGAVYEMTGRAAEAEARYREAIARNARLAPPHANLGRLLQSQSRHDEAAAIYRHALELGLDEPLFRHLLDAASGASSARAPAGYVSATFDAFASQFDQRLVGQLDYRVPRDLIALAAALLPDRPLDVLDLGCGTGLVGAALVDAQARHGLWVGIDLSAQMIERARQRGCYDELHCADVESWLADAPANRFDLVAAADVFIYIGDLAGVFKAVANGLRRGGVFAFSTESCAGVDWHLLESGRYAQSASFIERLAADHGFAVARRAATTIRGGVPGEMFILAME
jgi:predicted TPR repeat methyltransferase